MEIQEFEELFGNTPFEDIENIKKYIFQNYIPKSKIKEKIEELKTTNIILGGRTIGKTLEYGKKLGKLEVLQELMEDK